MYNYVKVIVKNENKNPIDKEKIYLFPMKGLFISLKDTVELAVWINNIQIITGNYGCNRYSNDYENLVDFKAQFDMLLEKISKEEIEKEEVKQLVIKLDKKEDGTISLNFWNYYYESQENPSL